MEVNMNTKIKILVLIFIIIAVGIIAFKYLQNRPYKLQEGDIQLNQPTSNNNASLMEAFQKRRSSRAFSSVPLTEETITNLLWSANGVNSADGKRTAPSARNKQEIELYAILPNGAYLYMPNENILKRVSPINMTDKTGYNAPMTIVFVANTLKQDAEWAYTDIGFIGQNIYLFCAVNGLNTVFKGSFDENYFQEALQLPEHMKILAIQDIGYPIDK
jgi:nitroreductase